MVSLTFVPQPAYLGGLLAGLLAAVVLVGLALLGRGDPGLDHAVDGAVGGRGVPLAAAGLLCAALLGGWPGLVAGLVAVAAALLFNRASIAGGLAVASGVVAAFAPWPERLSSADALLAATALLAIGALAAAAAPERRWLGATMPSDDGPMSGPAVPGQTTRH